jgi:hypothetical protein
VLAGPIRCRQRRFPAAARCRSRACRSILSLGFFRSSNEVQIP